MKKRQLDNNNKEAYRQLCETNDMYLFMQHWWLEGVSAGKDWDVILVYDDNDPTKIIGALPIELEKRLWVFSCVCQPEMTPYEGFWVCPELRDDPKAIEKIFRNISSQLAARHIRSFKHTLPVNSQFPHLLSNAGYKIIERTTYVLKDTDDIKNILFHFSVSKRSKLEKIQKIYRVEDLDPEEFYRFHVATAAQKHEEAWYTREMLMVLTEKASEHNQVRLLGVRGENEQLLAAALLVWDNHTLYQLVNTFDHDVPDNGARELLTLEAIKQAGQLGLAIDFTSHRSYLKNYGAQKQTYYSVLKGSWILVTSDRFSDWLIHHLRRRH